MVFKTPLRSLAALAIFVVMATVHGEGTRRESTQDELDRARAALQRATAKQKTLLKTFTEEEKEPDEVVAPNLPNTCPHGDPAWNAWFLNTIPFLLQTVPPDKEGDDPYLKPADVSARASQVIPRAPGSSSA